MRTLDSGNRKPVLHAGLISLFGTSPNEDTLDMPVLLPGPSVQITTLILLRESGEAGIDPVSLIGGQRSSGEDLVEVLHHDGFDPSESLDIQGSPQVREDNGPVKPEVIHVSPSQKFLELSDIAG